MIDSFLIDFIQSLSCGATFVRAKRGQVCRIGFWLLIYLLPKVVLTQNLGTFLRISREIFRYSFRHIRPRFARTNMAPLESDWMKSIGEESSIYAFLLQFSASLASLFGNIWNVRNLKNCWSMPEIMNLYKWKSTPHYTVKQKKIGISSGREGERDGWCLIQPKFRCSFWAAAGSQPATTQP